MMIKIKTPATTANLGPGFDCLGMALDLYNTFYFEEALEFSFTGVRDYFKKVENNLLAKAYIAAFDYKKEKIKPVHVSFSCEVPESRGLGSSATCIIGGLLGANHFLENKMTTNEILALATKIEGHPDNVAPCLLGGLVASFMDDGVNYVKYNPADSIVITALIPDFPLKTEASRKVLPKEISLGDCVYNISRSVNIPYAFEHGDLELLEKCLHDKIHQPYRFPIIDDSLIFLDYARENKLPFVISGAGPTLLLLSKEKPIIKVKTKHNWQYLNLKVCKEGSVSYE